MSKNFYIIISENSENLENTLFDNLNERYFKIKECLFRCGNKVQDINSKNEVKELFNNFFNFRIYLK